MRRGRIVRGEPSEELRSVALVGAAGVMCSGALIASDVVVTAAHCVVEDSGWDGATVVAGHDASHPTHSALATALWVHPNWNPLYDEFDVAAVRVSSPLSDRHFLLPSKQEVATSLRVGTTARLVGYGWNRTPLPGLGGQGGDGGDSSLGVRREASATVTLVEESTFEISPALTCSGDSGGPVVVAVEGEDVLVGVHARSNCDTSAIATKIEPFLDELRDFQRDTDSPPRDTTACSMAPGEDHPSEWALPFAALLGLLWRRRVRKRGARGRTLLVFFRRNRVRPAFPS